MSARSDKPLKNLRRSRRPKAKRGPAHAVALCVVPEEHAGPVQTTPLNAVAILQTTVESAFALQMPLPQEDAILARDERVPFLLAQAQSSLTQVMPHVSIRIHEAGLSRYSVEIGLVLQPVQHPRFCPPRIFESMETTLDFLEAFDAASLLLPITERTDAYAPSADHILMAAGAWLTTMALRREYRFVAGALIEALSG